MGKGRFMLKIIVLITIAYMAEMDAVSNVFFGFGLQRLLPGELALSWCIFFLCLTGMKNNPYLFKLKQEDMRV